MNALNNATTVFNHLSHLLRLDTHLAELNKLLYNTPEELETAKEHIVRRIDEVNSTKLSLLLHLDTLPLVERELMN